MRCVGAGLARSRIRLRDCDPGTQPGHAVKIVVGLRVGREVEGDGQPEFRAIRMPKCFRHHTDDRVGRVIQFDRLPQDIVASAQIALPEIVSEQHHVRTAGLILRCRKITAEHRLQAENIEEVGADPGGRENLR